MFHHVKDLQFDVRVSGPDLRFARLLLEQFGGGNGELKAALQYFVQAFSARQPYPDKYDLLMDIATEEFSHLEIVGATVTLLLNGLNADLKDAAARTDIARLASGRTEKDQIIGAAATSAQFLVLTGGGPAVTNCEGVPFSGAFINATGDLTVDLRSNIAAESRAKIVYEYLLQFTDDPHVKDTLRFLMTREIAHFQMFSAALESIQPNFPPGVLQGDARFTHTYYNMSNGADVRGPWNEGNGPWPREQHWEYVPDPERMAESPEQIPATAKAAPQVDPKELERREKSLGTKRSQEVKSAVQASAGHWNPEMGSPGGFRSRRPRPHTPAR